MYLNILDMNVVFGFVVNNFMNIFFLFFSSFYLCKMSLGDVHEFYSSLGPSSGNILSEANVFTKDHRGIQICEALA